MKIGLNNPHTKSIVLSTTDFSADELNANEPVMPKSKRIIRKKRRTGAPKQP
jgi:hypothetical protein